MTIKLILAKRELADFYTNGWLVEKDLQKVEYWNKISECNKKGISIQKCQTSEKELTQ
jgi:hypothetical protein